MGVDVLPQWPGNPARHPFDVVTELMRDDEFEQCIVLTRLCTCVRTDTNTFAKQPRTDSSTHPTCSRLQTDRQMYDTSLSVDRPWGILRRRPASATALPPRLAGMRISIGGRTLIVGNVPFGKADGPRHRLHRLAADLFVHVECVPSAFIMSPVTTSV